MNLDFERNMFESAVDTAVRVLLPRMSCGPRRWLTFELEMVNKDGETLPYTVRYRAMSNYIDWQVFLHKEDKHYKLVSDKMGPAPWVPVVGKKEKVACTYDQDNGEEVSEWAPGFVIADGCHDSCWRQKGTRLTGRPAIDGKPKIYVPLWEIESIRVLKVTVEGNASERFQQKNPHLLLWRDKWVNGNPTDLTGAWAIYTALAYLAEKTGVLTTYTVIPEDQAQKVMACRGGVLDGAELLDAPPDFKPFYNEMKVFEWVEEKPLWFRLTNRMDFLHLVRAEGLTHYEVCEPLELNLDTTAYYYKPGDEPGRYTQTSERRNTVGYRFGPDGILFATRLITRSIFDDTEWQDNAGYSTINRDMHLRLMGVSRAKIDAGMVGINHIWDR